MEKIKFIVKGQNKRNEMHFEVQRNTRANTFRDKTKYTRKEKHKNVFEW